MKTIERIVNVLHWVSLLIIKIGLIGMVWFETMLYVKIGLTGVIIYALNQATIYTLDNTEE